MVKYKMKYKKMRDLVVNVLNQDFVCYKFGRFNVFSFLCSTFQKEIEY